MLSRDRAEHNRRSCCSSWTSETRGPTSERSAAKSCSSTGALRRSAVDRRPAGGRAAQPAGAARLLLRGHRGLDRLLDRAGARARNGQRWPAATSGTRCWRSAPAKTGMAIRYDNPREIGPDRLVNAVDPRAPRRPRVVVDFGTATTFDLVSHEGVDLGGSQMRVEISLEALPSAAPAAEGRSRGAQERDRQDHVDAIRSGIVFGYAGGSTRSYAGCATSSASERG